MRGKAFLPAFALPVMLFLTAAQDDDIMFEDMMAGGPISNALEVAITEKDTEALLELSGGKILFVDREAFEQTGELIATDMLPSAVFGLVETCDLFAKNDRDGAEDDFEGALAWNCKSDRSPGNSCDFRTVSVEVRKWRLFSPEPAFYVMSDYMGYNSELCGTPRPASREELGL